MRGNRIPLLFITVICTFCFTAAGYGEEQRPASAGDQRATLRSTFGEGSGTGTIPPGQSRRIYRILSLIEKKTGDQRVLDRIRYKLSTISEERFRTILSLSEHIRSEGSEAEADVAFLLLTTLIIFS